MTDYYVRSGATGLGNGTSWTNAYTTIATAIATKAAGDRFFVSEDHSETTAGTVGLTFPGTANTPNIVLCVNHSGSVPPVPADLRATAVIATSGSATLSLSGGIYVFGVTFSCATSGTPTLGVGAAFPFNIILDNCTLKLGSSGGGFITFGQNSVPNNTSAKIELRSTNLSFASASAGISLRQSPILWRGGAVQNVAPTNLFLSTNSPTMAYADVRDVDLSLIGASKFLVSGAIATPGNIKFTNCKLSGSLGGVVNGSIGHPGMIAVDLVVSDSSTATYREEHYQYAGSITQETTIVLTSGASDGTTAKSWKMVANSGATYLTPLVSPDIFQWLDLTGSRTLTIELVNSGTTLKTNEIWMEVEYLGDASTPLGSLASTAPSILDAGANVTTSTAAWTSSPASPVYQLLAPVLSSPTVAQVGWFRVRVVLARASQTVYVNPLVTVS